MLATTTGSIAALFTTVAYIPQLKKCWATGKADDLSFKMFALLASGIALCCIALSIILLMAPAAVHRISFAGEDSPKFLAIGSWFVITGPFPLALGIALDTYVATTRALESTVAAASLAGLTALLLMLLWYAYPLFLRIRQRNGHLDA
jgi:uncharacterized protein with PQ loop repeat